MITRYQLARRAVKLWNSKFVPKEINRSNARKWMRSVEMLGERWLFAQDWTERAKAQVQQNVRT